MPGGGIYQVGPGNPATIQYGGPAQYGAGPFRFAQGPSEGISLQQGQQDFEKSTELPFKAGQAQADRDLQARMQAAQQQAQANQSMFDRSFQAQQGEAQRGFQGQQAGAQRDFQGQQNALDRGNQLSIAQMPWDYKNKVFGTISPLLQGLLGSAPNGGGTSTQGGPIPPAPEASREAVWTPEQVQANVNNQRSVSAQQAATQERGNARDTAAKGFGSNSPLLAALNGQVQAARMQGDAQAGLDTRLNAAKLNADQGIARDKVNSANYGSQLDAISRQKQSQLNYTSSLVAALAGMI